MFVVFAPNSKLNHLLHADITKIHKVIFSFGSDSCFKLMQRCHVNKLGGGGGGEGVTGLKTMRGLRGWRLRSFSPLVSPRD